MGERKQMVNEQEVPVTSENRWSRSSPVNRLDGREFEAECEISEWLTFKTEFLQVVMV